VRNGPLEANVNDMVTAEPVPTPLQGAGERVLVVEDNSALRRAVVLLLRILHYEPLEANDPTAALRVLEQETIDLMFTDLMMPGAMDGLALARLAEERWPGLKILLTSGLSAEVARHRFGPELDAFPLLTKPYRLHEFSRKLDSVLRG
jgi:CheY-like chemotaxis protein